LFNKIGLSVKIFVLNFLALIFLSPEAFAENYKLRIKSATNVSSENVKTIQALLETHLADLGYNSVLANENLNIDLSMIGVGEGARISAQKILKTGKVFSTSQIAATASEFDRVVKRVATDLVSENRQATVDSVTSEESQKNLVKESTARYFSVAFGPSGSYGLGAEGALIGVRLGYLWEVSGFRPGLFFLFGGNINGPSVGQNHFGISFDKVFFNTSFSPYIGAEFSYGSFRSARKNDKNEELGLRGFSLAPRIGYLMLRTSSVSVNTSLYFRPALSKLDGKGVGDAGLLVGLDF
jgi:hypothetical protein